MFSLFYLNLVLISILLTAAPMYDMEKHCNIEIAAQISRISTPQNGISVLSAYEFFLLVFFFSFSPMHVCIHIHKSFSHLCAAEIVFLHTVLVLPNATPLG